MKIIISKKSYKENESGFTFLELIITLVVLLLVSSLAVPNFLHRLEKQKIITTARKIRGFMMLTREEAIRKDKTIYLVFLPLENILVQKPDVGAISLRKLPRLRKFHLDSSITMLGFLSLPFHEYFDEDLKFEFHPDGTLSGGWLYLKSLRTKNQMTLFLNRITGQVTVLKGHIKEFKELRPPDEIDQEEEK